MNVSRLFPLLDAALTINLLTCTARLSDFSLTHWLISRRYLHSIPEILLWLLPQSLSLKDRRQNKFFKILRFLHGVCARLIRCVLHQCWCLYGSRSPHKLLCNSVITLEWHSAKNDSTCRPALSPSALAQATDKSVTKLCSFTVPATP